MTPMTEFIQKMKEKDVVLHYIQVWHKDELVEEYNRLDQKTRLNVYSVSKSVTSLGVGIAMGEKLLTAEDRLLDFFPEYRHQDIHPNVRKITVHDLLTMNCGLSSKLFFADDPQRYREHDWVDFFMKNDFGYEPGTHFEYCNFNTYMLSCIIEKLTGESLVEYMKPRFFEPLQIGNADWLSCPMGHSAAANGLMLTIDEMSAIGRLLLNQGKWEGSTLVPEWYLKEATRNQITNEVPKCGYGYQFWINPDYESYRADGKYGQYIVVVPEQQLVVSLQALDSKKFFDDVWKDLVVPCREQFR